MARAPDSPDLTPPTELELQILLALGTGPLHGYGIIQDIEARAGVPSDLRSGTLYLAIRRLRSNGLVEPSDPPEAEKGGDARRKYVCITPLGREVVSQELSRLRELVRLGEKRALLEPGRP